MTFTQWLLGAGITVLNDIPTAIILYVAVRLAFQHSELHYEKRGASAGSPALKPLYQERHADTRS